MLIRFPASRDVNEAQLSSKVMDTLRRPFNEVLSGVNVFDDIDRYNSLCTSSEFYDQLTYQYLRTIM